MEVICKENTHKSSKTHKNCDCCVQSYSCKKCRGVCIFSEIFLKKFPESRSIRRMAKERFYPREFELIRSFDAVGTLDVPVVFAVEDEDESDEEDEVNRNEIYELLQKFHKLTLEQKKAISKVHGNHLSYFEPWKNTPHVKLNKGNKILSFYQHQANSKDSRDARYGSRQQKVQSNIYYGSNMDL